MAGRFQHFIMLVLVVGFVFAIQGQDYTGLHGYVKNAQGVPLDSAVVVIVGTGHFIYTLADNKGYYTFGDGGDTIVEINTIEQPVLAKPITINNGVMTFTLEKSERVHLSLYDLSGRLVYRALDKKLNPGKHSVALHNQSLAKKAYILRAGFGKQTTSCNYLPFSSSLLQLNATVKSPALANRQQYGLLRVSSPGYRTKISPIPSLTQIDFALDTLISQVGTHVVQDGCMDRMTIWGVTKYYWGDIGFGQNVPLVKIIHAKSHRVVDAAIIFNPAFVDNTYGINKVGWTKHTFESLVKSDHVQFAFLDGAKDSVFHVKLDFISQTDTTVSPSGYASLGVNGGDGAVITGSASDIYSWGTSLDDNINYYGYRLFVDSPETDSIFTPNPNYPYWEFYTVYHICVNTRAFGQSDFSDVYMSFVHASPSKNGPDTVPITTDITTLDPINPFIHVQTFTVPDIQ